MDKNRCPQTRETDDRKRKNSENGILPAETSCNIANGGELDVQEQGCVQERSKRSLMKCGGSRNILDFINLSRIDQKISPSSEMDVEEHLMKRAATLHQYTLSEGHLVGESLVLVSAIAWHPKYTNILAIATNDGNIVLWDVNKNVGDGILLVHNIQPNVSCIRFHPSKPLSMYTSSMTGKVMFTNFERKSTETLLDNTRIFDSIRPVDVSFRNKILLVGSKDGYVDFVTLENKKLQTKMHFHKSYVMHIEFSRKYEYLFATASHDCTVKLWDMRKITNSSNKCQNLAQLDHSKGVLSGVLHQICYAMSQDMGMK